METVAEAKEKLIKDIDAWRKSRPGQEYACARTNYYTTPEANCVGCLLKRAQNLLEQL